MAFVNKPSFAVSVTPKGTLAADNANNEALTLMHENVRKTLGGSGDVTSDGNDIEGGTGGSWADGVYTQLTNSSNAGAIANNAATDLVFIKNTGTLVAGGAVNDATTSVLVKVGAAHSSNSANVTIAELLSGEAIVLPRPGSDSAIVLATGNGAGGTSSNHVLMEVLLVGT